MTPHRDAEHVTPQWIERDLDALAATITGLIAASRAGVDRLRLVEASARSLGAALDLDKMLAWKLRSLADAPDPASAVRHIPGGRGWSRICAAFESRGHVEQATALRHAWRIFDAALDERQLSRSALTTLVTSTPRAGAESSKSDARSALSDAFTTIWGVGETAFLSVWILSPAREQDRLSAARIKLHHGLHRTRPGPEWHLNYRSDSRRIPDVPAKDRPEISDAPWEEVDCRDLVTESAENQIERSSEDGVSLVTFHGRDTSPRRPIDIVLAAHASPVAYQSARDPGEYGSFGTGIRVPAGLLVCDFLIDTRIPWPAPPSAVTVLQPEYMLRTNEVRQQQRMPMTETPEAPIAAPGDDDLALPDSLGQVDAMYRGALDRVLERMELDLSQLVLHRLVVPSPMLASTVSLRWLLPKPPM